MASGQNDTCFGDVSILAVGDLFQLQPVRQGHVFDLPSDPYARLYGSLWQEHFQLFELTQTMRQRDDVAFAELLGRVRTASCTKDDIATLKSREILPTHPNYPTQALHVFKTNAQVDAHNDKHLQRLHHEGKPVVHIEAKDSKRDKQTEQLSDIPTPTKRAETGGLHTVLRLAVGARVMLTVNVDVTDGLCNSASGTVVGFHANGNAIIAVLVQFDHDRVGSKARAESQYKRRFPQAVPIFRHEASFQVGRGRGVIQKTRQQFPLTLAWACTIHKVQGTTLDKIVVSMEGRGAFQPGQAYVALSRVKTIHGLHILGFSEAAIRLSPAVQEETNRLKCNTLSFPAETSIFSTNTDSIDIGLLNVRSYKRHLPDLKNEPVLQKASVLCFVETFLKPNSSLTPADLLLPSCKVFRAERHVAQNLDKGGIMIQAQTQVFPVALEIDVPGLEYKAITIKWKQSHVNIITLYRRPLLSSARFLDLVQHLLAKIDTTRQTVILGDFNINLLDTQVHTHGHSILTTMTQHGFRQIVVQPTTDSQALLDHVYTNIRSSNVSVLVQDCYFSDHDYVLLSLHA